jgi:hypothetical protein
LPLILLWNHCFSESLRFADCPAVVRLRTPTPVTWDSTHRILESEGGSSFDGLNSGVRKSIAPLVDEVGAAVGVEAAA